MGVGGGGWHIIQKSTHLNPKTQPDVLYNAFDALPHPAMTPRAAFQRLMSGAFGLFCLLCLCWYHVGVWRSEH